MFSLQLIAWPFRDFWWWWNNDIIYKNEEITIIYIPINMFFFVK